MSSGKLTLGRPATTTSFGSAPADMKMLADMVDMGFDSAVAGRALSAVNNKSIDLAINYITENPEEDDQIMIEQSIANSVANNVAPVTASQPNYVPQYIPEEPPAPKNIVTLMDEHIKLVKGGLRSDDPDVKEAFRRKLLAEEAAKREKERKDKNQALKELRKKMKQEKEERLEKQNKKLLESTNSNIIVKPYTLNPSTSSSSASSSTSTKEEPVAPPKKHIQRMHHSSSHARR